jgi:hypothetical protein
VLSSYRWPPVALVGLPFGLNLIPTYYKTWSKVSRDLKLMLPLLFLEELDGRAVSALGV